MLRIHLIHIAVIQLLGSGDEGSAARHGAVGKREETQEINVNWRVAMRPGKRKVLDKNSPMGAIMDKLVQAQARIRTKVKHPFRVIKR